MATANVKTTTPRKTTARKAAPAKRAPAKAAPAKVVRATGGRKLRWQVDGGNRALAGKVGQTSLPVDGYVYAILGTAKDGFVAVVRHAGKTTKLVESPAKYSVAYWACVKHNQAR
jgi:hypothetical protein